MPNVTGYPMKAVFAIITVTRTDHNFLSSNLSCFKIKQDMIPVANDDAKIINGKMPNFGIKDMSAVKMA